MDDDIPTDGFYASYARYKNYATPTLSDKDAARFDTEIWGPAAFSPESRCLEIGCGTGAFLAYLARKGVSDLQGIDHDPALAAVMPEAVAETFLCIDVWAYLEDCAPARFDRVVLLDVLEHFTAEEGFELMTAIVRTLAPGGKVVIKVPNAASPWGLSYQTGDLTHRTGYSGDSLRQLATACGLAIEALYDQRRGSSRRRVTDALVNRFLSWALLVPPKLWGANLYAVLSRP